MSRYRRAEVKPLVQLVATIIALVVCIVAALVRRMRVKSPA